MRCLWTLLTALMLVVAPAAAADDRSGVCVGGLEIVACVPPERS